MGGNRITYDTVDFVKFIFAILIFTLHLPNLEIFGKELQVIAQFFGRLGVPYFFIASGFFLGKKLQDIHLGRVEIFRSYMIRIGGLLLAWLFIYLPILLFYRKYTGNNLLPLWQEILFKCPAYLWYLVATLFGCIPILFFFRKYQGLLCCVAIVFYLVGVTGNTYLYIDDFQSFWASYLKIFLTTRNGLFFGFPFICLGAILYRCYNKNHGNTTLYAWLTLVFYLLFAFEVWLAKDYYKAGGDCSMYFSMPLVTAFIFLMCLSVEVKIPGSKVFRMLSTWMYLSQFFVILLIKTIYYHFELKDSFLLWGICVVFSVCLFLIIKRFLCKIFLYLI